MCVGEIDLLDNQNINHLRSFKDLSICIIREGFFAFIISLYYSYLFIFLLNYLLIRS